MQRNQSEDYSRPEDVLVYRDAPSGHGYLVNRVIDEDTRHLHAVFVPKQANTLERLLNDGRFESRPPAHPANIDAAHREIAQRAAEGEPMDNAYVDPYTSAIRFA